MALLMSSAANLEHARRQLLDMRFTGQKEVARLMALAECSFRLAVHPDTPADLAIERLHEAIRIDGSNPKYAYHLSRIHFIHGRFQEASRWIRMACCLAPTSHRIWAHVAVLLEELNAVFHGNEYFEPNVLAKRSEKIIKAIQAGDDNIDADLLDFMPPKSRAAEEKEARQGGREQPSSSQNNSDDDFRPPRNVKRYLHAKQCRWSGVDDLLIERLLRGRPTQANVRLMAPILQRLSERAKHRQGGPAAVAILCTQWLCGGYPVETVRRIMQALPPQSASHDFLDRICRIYESPEQDVSRLIAEALESGQIPPVVAAMIHRQRLLWHPLEFRSLGSYRAAWAVVAENRNQNGKAPNVDPPNDSDLASDQLEAARDLIRRLDRAMGSLSPSPPKKLRDEIPKPKTGPAESDSRTLLDKFEAFEAAAKTLMRLKDEGFRLIKDQIDAATKDLSTVEVFNQANADHRAAQQFVSTIATTTESCLNEFQTLCRELPDVEGIELPADFATRCEDCIGTLQGASNFGKFSKVLKRIEKRLISANGVSESSVEPAAEWSALLSGTKAALVDAMNIGNTRQPESSITERLELFEDVSFALETSRTGLSEFLRVWLEPATKDECDPQSRAQAVTDIACCETLFKSMAAGGEQGLARLETLATELQESGAADLPDEYDARLEATRNRFRTSTNLGSLLRRLQRIARKLTKIGQDIPQNEGLPSAELQQWKELIGRADFNNCNESKPESDNPVKQWCEESAALQRQMTEDWPFLKDCVKHHNNGGLDSEQESRLVDLRIRVDQALSVADQRISEIAAFRQSGEISSTEIEEIEVAEQQYLQVLKNRGKFLKNLSKLPSSVVESKSNSQNEDKPQRVAGENGKPSRPPQPSKPSDQMTVMDQLGYTLIFTDWSINQMFATALETFSNYSEWILVLPPFEALRRQVFGRLAEVSYRLGRRKTARRIWNRMLRTNRLDVDALKNIAICDTAEEDVSRNLISWREYLELLYMFDILAGNPRLHAPLRAEFHRAFGNAYAPGFLSAQFDHEWKDKVDSAALISFLSSPGRFRGFINHRRLEYLNLRFGFESPSLVLGIKRVEAESHGDEAEKTMTEFVNRAGELLPSRVAKPFTQLAASTMRAAAEKCRKTSYMTLRSAPAYDDEVTRQVELLARMFDLKLKLYFAFRDNANIVKNITSFDFLSELDLLDTIPLKLSPGLFPIVASKLQADLEALEDMTATLRSQIIWGTLKYLLADDDPAERPIRQRQYQLVTGSWLKHPDFADFAQGIDTPPPNFMPTEAKEALEQGRVASALDYLRQWHDDYPAMAGLSVLIANQLFKLKEFDEARTRLEASRKVVFYERTRRHIHYLLVQIMLREIEPLLDSQDYEPAFDIGLKMVRLDDFQSALVCQTLQLYMAVSGSKRRKHRSKEVDEAVNDWLERATALANSSEEENEPFPRPTEDDLEKVRKQYAESETQLNKL